MSCMLTKLASGKLGKFSKLYVVDNDRRVKMTFLGWQGIAALIGVLAVIILILVGFAKLANK